MYYSTEDNKFQLQPLFQSNPKYGDDDHQSWTESILSYKAAARHEATCLKLNRRCKRSSSYRYWATISLAKELPPKEVCSQWRKIKRKLRDHQIVARAITETDTKTNFVHWHLIISKWPNFEDSYLILQTSGRKLNFKIEADLLKPRFDCSLSHSIDNYIDYICKASDHHQPLLFRPNTGIAKVSTIGDFWVKPKKVFDKYLAEKYYHRTVEGMKQPGALDLVNMLDQWFDGFYSKRELCQKIGTASTCTWWSDYSRYETFKHWREKLCDTNYDPWQYNFCTNPPQRAIDSPPYTGH